MRFWICCGYYASIGLLFFYNWTDIAEKMVRL